VIVVAARLKWALLRGGLRSGPGSTQRRTGMVVSMVLGGLLALLGFLTLAALHGKPEADETAVLLFTGLVVGWAVLPILTFASDDLVDPAKLALLPLSRRQVVVVHGVGALVGVAPVASLIALSGVLIGTASGLGSLLVALVAVVLELALCVVLSRTVVAALSRLLRSRRGRDLGVALTALVAISVQLVNPLLSRVSGSPDAPSNLRRVADVLDGFPPGLLASAPRAARDGRWLAAIAHLLVAAGAVLVLVALWERSLRRAEEVPDATTGRKEKASSALVPSWLTAVVPSGRAGAIAGKDLRYLAREPRRLVQLVTSTLLPAIVIVVSPALSARQVSHGMVFTVCGIALFYGLQGSNRFGQEGTASWMLVAAGTDLRSARRDLVGGDVASALVGVPLVVVVGVAIAAFTDGWSLLPAALATALAVLTVSFGGGGLLSVLAPFPVPEGPRNAFSNGGGGQGVAAGFLGLGIMLGVLIACTPLLALLVPAVHGHRVWLLVLVAPLYGLAVGAGCRELAARMWAQRSPEVLLKVNAQR
jgi:ABC-2 type transport system permease protein